MNAYDWADNLYNSSPHFADGFTQQLAVGPYVTDPHVLQGYESRIATIRAFQTTALALFRAALARRAPARLLHWLLNETPASVGASYHRKLGDRHFTLPVFFRTDEAAPGRILEIQCPGSLWGDLQLTFEYARQLGWLANQKSPAERFAQQLTGLLPAEPVVHYLLDNASAPASLRYFVERTRPQIRYWGIDYGVRPEKCNFVRSHSFFGLCAENHFRLRLNGAGREVIYDLPPHVLFDQKAALVLPFWSLTRQAFSDDVRAALVFATPLLPDGIELRDGTRLTIQEFSRLSRTQRAFYLKYAGSNVALNWGSKAVYRLSSLSAERCLSLLDECLRGYASGRIWLIQEEEYRDDVVAALPRHGGEACQELLRAKFSGFYGPAGHVGTLAMHRHHNKVHGQPETIISYVAARPQDADSSATKLGRISPP